MARLLLLDDDESTLEWMAAALRACDHEVRTFASPRAALDAVASWHPDLVVADIFMPEIDGLAFTRLVTGNGAAKVMLVSIAQKRAEGVLAGASGYIQKPATAAEVRAAVERVLGRDAGRSTVLVVEDDDDVRSILVEELSPRFFVLDAYDGRRALEILRSRPVDLVITDVHMPVMNGVELLRAMRADPALERVPVIVQTSDRSALGAPVWRELSVSQLVPKSDFITWLQSRVQAHVQAQGVSSARA